MLRHASICHAGAILYPAQCAGLVSTDMTNGTHLRALPYATRSDPQPARRQYPIGQPDSEARTSDPRISSCNTVSGKIQCKPPSPLIEQKCSPTGLRPWPMCRRVQGSSCGSGAPSWAISATAMALGGGISEMRIDVGPGYRVYFARAGTAVYRLLCGGDKSRQQMDIQRAKALWDTISKGDSCVRLPSRASMPRTI